MDLSTIKSTVAFPHLPENTHTVDSIDDIKIDQVVIGSCTNGRIDDLRCAAKILEGRKVAKGLRVIVIPATQKIYMQAIEEVLYRHLLKQEQLSAHQPADHVLVDIWVSCRRREMCINN